MKNTNEALNFKMKPLFNIIENITLPFDHQKSAEQNKNTKSRHDQEKNWLKF